MACRDPRRNFKHSSSMESDMTRSNFGTRKATAWPSVFRNLRRLRQRGAGLRVPMPRFTSFAVMICSHGSEPDGDAGPKPGALVAGDGWREALCRVYGAESTEPRGKGSGRGRRCTGRPRRRSARQHQFARWTFKGPRALSPTSSGRQTRSFDYERYPPRTSKKVRTAVGRQICLAGHVDHAQELPHFTSLSRSSHCFTVGQ